MKSKFFILSLLLSFNSYAKTLIISDVDDTIKVTNVLSKTSRIANALLSKKAFSGMSELYQELNENDTSIYYLSGSPTLIKSRVDRFLQYNQFPQEDNLILKKEKASTYDYKLTNIRKLIKEINPDKLILIGDDTEYDPEVYDTVSKENEGKVESIYIRAIQNRKLPENVLIKNFISSVEIAAFELIKGNLKPASLDKVTDSFINQDHSSKIVIKGRFCPSEGRTQLEELKTKMQEQSSIDDLQLANQKIINTCKI